MLLLSSSGHKIQNELRIPYECYQVEGKIEELKVQGGRAELIIA